MKTLFTTGFYIICFMAAACIAGILIWNKPIPKGQEGAAAEAFADSMMAAVDCEAWQQIRFLGWNYDSKREYVWDKLYNLAEVRYADTRVLLNLNAVDGIVWKDGVRLSREEKRDHIQQAWKYWCNDSFWLNPVCKIRDEGTRRKLITLKDKSQGLLVTYAQGGVTPGDSYLWMVGEDYIPEDWRMWVRMLPVRGLKASWEDWISIEGAQVSTCHHIGPYRIDIQNLRSGRHPGELGLERDPFVDFVTE